MGEIGEYWRDAKAHKRQKPANPPRRRCWDWMIVGGDCHYAKNRSSFTTYRRIQGTAQGARVIGIGTVELQVQRSPKESGTHTLVLEDVLHIPEAICNGFNSRLAGGAESWIRGSVHGLDASSGQPLWYGTEFCGSTRLVLAGNPQGESVLEEMEREGSAFMLSVYLNEEEWANLFRPAC